MFKKYIVLWRIEDRYAWQVDEFGALAEKEAMQWAQDKLNQGMVDVQVLVTVAVGVVEKKLVKP